MMGIVLLLYLFAAFTIFIIPGKYRKNIAILISALQSGVFLFFLSKIKHTSLNIAIIEKIEWIPQLGLNLEFNLDGLSIIFALLISGIGILVFLYANAYMRSYDYKGRFYFYLTLFTGAMLGMVISENLIQLFIFWELTSFLSFLLISFFHEKEKARKAAFQSLFITAFGGLSLLSGIILLGSIVDSYTVTDWVAGASEIKSSSLYLPGLILILVGVFTKSAQFPFHFWLPGAMQAPTPVSAYLHSATMVKAGVFLLARLNPALGETIEWTYIIPLIGVLTMLAGSYFSLTQTDLKGILAYTTISALGILVLLIGIDTTFSIKAALLFLFVHAFYKATLFMIAGLIDKKTGTRDIGMLGGLYRYMPVTFIISLLALFSMAGLPPMLGFLGKELIYEAKVQSPGIASLVLVLGVVSNIFMVAVSLFFLQRVFMGKPQDTNTQPKGKATLFLIGPGILALLGLLFGLFPAYLGETLIEPALRVVQAEAYEVKLKLWHGFNNVFFLSLFTVISGVALSFLMIRKDQLVITWRKINNRLFSIKLSEVFTNAIDQFVNLSKQNTQLIQHGYHRLYLLSVIVITSILLWYQLFITRGWILETNISFQPFYISGLVLIITLAALYSTLSESRIAAIIAMGVAGYGISLIFMYYSAIDLAITQILAETITLVMFVLILQRLPRFAKLSSRFTKIRDLIIALIFGGVMTVLALKAIHIEFHHPISEFFLENSYTKAFGKNVVNVILVDFRALDTLGEVTVLTIAAIGVGLLLKNKKSKK